MKMKEKDINLYSWKTFGFVTKKCSNSEQCYNNMIWFVMVPMYGSNMSIFMLSIYNPSCEPVFLIPSEYLPHEKVSLTSEYGFLRNKIGRWILWSESQGAGPGMGLNAR